MKLKLNIFNKLIDLFETGSKGPHATMGLDIEPSSIALLELGCTEHKIELQHMAIVALDNDIVSYDDVNQPDALIKALNQVKRKAGIGSKTVAIIAPGTLVVTKEISLPISIKKDQWEFYAWSEARKIFSGLINNLYLDFAVDENVQTMEKTKLKKMLLIAARKQEMARRLKAIEDSGLQTKIIDVDYYALERAYPLIIEQLPKNHIQQHVALLHVDTAFMLMAVMHNDTMVYCHRQGYDGSLLSKLIEKYLFGDSMVEQINEGKEAQTKTASFLQKSSQVDRLANRIQHFLEFYYAESHIKKLDHIVLSGRCAVIPKLDEYVQQKVNIPTIVANPFCNFKISDNIDKTNIKRKAPAFMLSCGLALRGIKK